MGLPGGLYMAVYGYDGEIHDRLSREIHDRLSRAAPDACSSASCRAAASLWLSTVSWLASSAGAGASATGSRVLRMAWLARAMAGNQAALFSAASVSAKSARDPPPRMSQTRPALTACRGSSRAAAVACEGVHAPAAVRGCGYHYARAHGVSSSKLPAHLARRDVLDVCRRGEGDQEGRGGCQQGPRPKRSLPRAPFPVQSPCFDCSPPAQDAGAEIGGPRRAGASEGGSHPIGPR